MSKKKRLFSSATTEKSERDRHLVEVGGRNSDSDAYIRAFQEGGRLLVEHALKTGDGFTLYAAVFQYRHAIELRLKEILFSTQGFADLWAQLPSSHPLAGHDLKRLNDVLSRTHNLKELLEWVEALPAHVAGPFPTTARDAIIELHNIDPNGVAFRYARRKRQPERQVFDRIRTLDLSQIRDGLEAAIDYLATIGLRLAAQSYVGDADALGYAGWSDEEEDELDPDEFEFYREELDARESPAPGATMEERWMLEEVRGEIAVARHPDGSTVELPRQLLAPDIAAPSEIRIRSGLSNDSRVWKVEVAALTNVRSLDYIDYEPGSFVPKVRPPEDW